MILQYISIFCNQLKNHFKYAHISKEKDRKSKNKKIPVGLYLWFSDDGHNMY